MRVAIVGCGQFSRAHIRALKQIKEIEIVATCDRDPWRAKELANMAPGAQAYSELEALLRQQHPEVAHILTPPDTHASIAIQMMQAGCHVLVEKPMALSVEEADCMIAAAQKKGVKLSTDHNYLFNPCIAKARQLCAQGKIGQVIYIEGYYGLSDAGSSYTSVAGRSHWAWRLPGSAFSNFLPHLISLLLAFLPDEISVAGVTLAQGERRGEPPTELTVLLRGGTSASGVMTISMRARPYAKFLNIYGSKGIIHADLATEVCTLHKIRQLPSMVTKVLFNLEESAQLFAGTLLNTAKVAVGSLQRDPGLHSHLQRFYASLKRDGELPVSAEDGKRMIEIMEQVWAKAPIGGARSKIVHKLQTPTHPQTDAERITAERGLPGKVLVTGATGFLGYHVVLALARCGGHVVAFVRDRDRVSVELGQNADIFCGDLRDPASLEVAMDGVGVVYHCAAVIKNSIPWKTHHDVNIAGTEGVLKAALKAGVKRVIHVSSVIVYGLTQPTHDGPVDESQPFPKKTDRWAHYLRSKLEADRLALSYWHEANLPVTVLRLGILYGPGGRPVGRGLIQLGPLKLTIGRGRNRLPFIHVSNAVDCLLLSAVSPDAIGQAYNVVDEPQPTAREVALEVMKFTGRRSVLVPVPPLLLLSAARLFEWKIELNGSQTPPKLSRFVVRSAYRDIRYDTRKAREQLGWQPAVTLEEGLRNTLA